jgi:hypothetical protein
METIVSLQEKYLFMLEILQSADRRPTQQVVEGLEKLEQRLREMLEKAKVLMN